MKSSYLHHSSIEQHGKCLKQPGLWSCKRCLNLPCLCTAIASLYPPHTNTGCPINYWGTMNLHHILMAKHNRQQWIQDTASITIPMGSGSCSNARIVPKQSALGQTKDQHLNNLNHGHKYMGHKQKDPGLVLRSEQSRQA